VSETDQAGGHAVRVRRARPARADGRAQQKTTYGYDEVGNRTTQTDANGHTTRFEHDKLEERQASFGGAAETKTTTRRATRDALASRPHHGYAYDVNHRLLSRTYPNPPRTSLHLALTGRRLTAADAAAPRATRTICATADSLTYPMADPRLRLRPGEPHAAHGDGRLGLVTTRPSIPEPAGYGHGPWWPAQPCLRPEREPSSPPPQRRRDDLRLRHAQPPESFGTTCRSRGRSRATRSR
jgi:YD repeat-containing protein